MLEFYHRDASTEHNYGIWPFVYFHGEAERMNNAAFEAGGDAPDLCMCNKYMHDYITLGFKSHAQHGDLMTFSCKAGGLDAICVIACVHGQIQGRIALATDHEGLRHALSPKEWR